MSRAKKYVNNVDLLEELYVSIERDELTRTCLDMLMKLAQRTQRKLYYSCEDDKQQCLSEAYLDIAKRWKRFDPFKVRSTGFELMEVGQTLKFYLDPKDRSTLIKCEVIEEPELCAAKGDLVTYLKLSEINLNLEDTKEGHAKANPHLYSAGPYRGPKLPSITEVLNDKFVNEGGSYDGMNSKVKVKYKVNGTSKSDPTRYEEITIIKANAVVKEPNPFSYFTSICINGYAKGYKELRPKKDKGRFISLDAGFNNSDGTDLFNM
jgi:hypothetical protein